jgi:hypothetical protein
MGVDSVVDYNVVQSNAVQYKYSLASLALEVPRPEGHAGMGGGATVGWAAREHMGVFVDTAWCQQ